MWLLFKNISRYAYQKKFSIFGIFLLLLIAIMIFVTFGLLSQNLINAYNNLVQNGNLANIVVDEDYKAPVKLANGTTENPEAEFEAGLNNLGVYYRQFNSVNITTTNSHLFKVIDYPNNAVLDRVVVFKGAGDLPTYEKHPTIPVGVDFQSTIQLAQTYYDQTPGTTTPAKVISSLQLIAYEAAGADWSGQSLYAQNLNTACQYIDQNPGYNPAGPLPKSGQDLAQDRSALQAVAQYFNIWLNAKNPNYTPPITNGYRITFGLTNLPSNTEHIPILGYYSDFSAYVAIVSPAYLKANNKQIYSYQTFWQSLDHSRQQMISQVQFIKYFNSIPNQYKVFVDKVPYVIIGSGISPGFMYPIIDFENIIPNPATQGIIYTNPQGYGRIQFSFPTAPTENMLVCKYVGPTPLKTIVKKINVLAHQYMVFPSNMTLAYTVNNVNNTFSPAGLRVTFVTKLVLSIRVVSTLISLFILVMSLVVIIMFTRKFIEDNQTIIGIMLANGINKLKIIFSISLIGWLPAFLAGVIGFLVGFFTQSSILGLFSAYWMIPTPTAAFNFGEFFLAFFCAVLVFVLLTFLWSYLMLRQSVMEMMKSPANFRLSFITIFFKKLMDWAPTLVKFRFSIAFSAMGKILLLSVVSLVTTVTFLFITATANAFQTALTLSQKTNHSTFQINLTTPTIQGGQYALEPYAEQGTQIFTYPTLTNAHHTIINDLGYNQMASRYYQTYQELPLFREWAGIFWPSINNLSQISTEPTFLKYHTSFQLLSDTKFGIGTTSSNPWLTTMAMIPANQANTSIELTQNLIKLVLGNMIPLNWVPMVQPNNPFKASKVGIPMPNEWVIGNIGLQNKPGAWVDNAGSPQIGFLNGATIFPGLTASQIVALGPQVVTDKLDAYYRAVNPQMFQASNLSGLAVTKTGQVTFNYTPTTTPNIITTRSLFRQWFCAPIPGESTSGLVSYPDPFNTNIQYHPNEENILMGMMCYSYSYISFICHLLSNPIYQQDLYKFTYDSLIWNAKVDEPFTYVTAQIANYHALHTPYRAPKTIQINGILPNATLIHLSNANGQLINNLLNQAPQTVVYNHQTVLAYNLIPNEYAMRFYNLHLGEVLKINPLNSVYRDEPGYQPADHPVYYRIVGVNNSVHNAEFWTNMTSAQLSIGLATATDYENQVVSPMNNMYNPFGGFNGIFTAEPAPFTLTKNIALYSPSGLYPGTSSFTFTSVFGTLMVNMIKDAQDGHPQNLDLVFKALYLPTTNQYTKALADGTVSPTALAQTLINQLKKLYGSIIYDSIIQKPVAFQNMAAMFTNLSSIIVKIKLMVAIIILVISLLMMFLLAWIVINDLIKIATLLKTQGYSDWSNAVNFFSLFIPAWILDVVFTIPLTMLILHFYKHFIFVSVNVLLSSPITAWAFIAITLGLTAIFFIIFSMAFVALKRLNLIQVLKW